MKGTIVQQPFTSVIFDCHSCRDSINPRLSNPLSLEMADTTGRIPLWLIGTVTGILVIGLIGVFFYSSNWLPISIWYRFFLQNFCNKAILFAHKKCPFSCAQ
ncbi:hypothetical protein ACJX0J_037070 [Zea mays]